MDCCIARLCVMVCTLEPNIQYRFGLKGCSAKLKRGAQAPPRLPYSPTGARSRCKAKEASGSYIKCLPSFCTAKMYLQPPYIPQKHGRLHRHNLEGKAPGLTVFRTPPKSSTSEAQRGLKRAQVFYSILGLAEHSL